MYYKCTLEYFRKVIDLEGFVEIEENSTEVELGKFKNKDIAFAFANSLTPSKLQKFGFHGNYDIITISHGNYIDGIRSVKGDTKPNQKRY